MTDINSRIPPSRQQAAFGSELEQQIAQALIEKGKFDGCLSAEELEPIFGTILLALVSRQMLQGREILVESEVISIHVAIAGGLLRVHSKTRLIHPIAAELTFEYTLENAPLSPSSNLCLKDNLVHVVERTARFDLFAKMALSAVGVKQIAQRELSNPAQIIKKTLPARLRLNGCTIPLSEVKLRLREDNLLSVHVLGQIA